MPTSRQFLQVLTSEQIQEVHTVALRVLEEMGLWLPNDEVLEIFYQAGAWA